MRKGIRGIAFAISMALLTTGFPTTSFAGMVKKAHLHFYTIDGDEIRSLRKTLKVTSSDKYAQMQFTFPDPNKYKILPRNEYPYSDYDYKYELERYEDVSAIGWVEEDEYGNGSDEETIWPSGTVAAVTEGEYHFRVRTDWTWHTGENMHHSSSDQHAFLYFFNENAEEIEDLAVEMNSTDATGYADVYTFLDPADYSVGDYKGTYWYVVDYDGDEHLIKKGESWKFPAYDYEFYIRTEEPVQVYFHYPWLDDMGESGANPGDIYYQKTVHVGDSVKMLNSLGTLEFGYAFKGWQCDELATDDDEEYPGFFSANSNGYCNGSFTIMNNGEYHFYAIYEEDENADNMQEDLNQELKEDEEDDGEFSVFDKAASLVQNAEQVNEIGGQMYGAEVDESTGKLTRSSGSKQINSVAIPNSGGSGGEPKTLTLKGIQGRIKWDVNRSALKNKNDDPMEPDNYTKDKYGRKREELENGDELRINEVLMQHDAAMYMDCFGNSFVYHSNLPRLADMALAYKRYSDAQTPGFAQLVSKFDEGVQDRQLAIEFALLCGKYPTDPKSVYNDFNANTNEAKAYKEEIGLSEDDKIPEWKEEYMSETAYNNVKFTKLKWQFGWMDSYDDGYYEKLVAKAKEMKGGSVSQVGAIRPSFVENFASMFFITAHAYDYDGSSGDSREELNSGEDDSGEELNSGEDDSDEESDDDGDSSSGGSETSGGSTSSVRINGGSYGKRIGAVVNDTIDVKEGLTKFRPVYHDESNITYSISTSFSNITIVDGNGNEYTLSPDECSTLSKLFEFFVNELNFSEAMAAGACGNLYQECGFDYTAGNDGDKGAYGLVQWMAGRKTALKNYASKNGGKISDLDMQLGYLKQELQSNAAYNLAHINSYLAKYAGTKDGKTVDVTNIDDVDMATDAWCVIIEGCTCFDSSGKSNDGKYHGKECCMAANGKSYQQLVTRKRYANSFHSQSRVIGSGGDVAIGGDFAGMSNAEILTKIFGVPSLKQVKQRMSLSQASAKYCTGKVTIKNKKGGTRTISGVNKYVTDALQKAIDEITATGFEFSSDTYVYRTSANTSNSGSWSFHNVGLAIDINYSTGKKSSAGWGSNPQFYLSSYPTSAHIIKIWNPNTDPYALSSREANIFKSHGWLWGRDFSNRPDMMHVVVGEVGQDGRNKWISDEIEGKTVSAGKK